MNSFQSFRLLTILIASFCTAFPSHAASANSDKTKTTTSETKSSQSTKAAKIDLNTADVATLEALPGVGPQTARAIVAARPFTSVNDLERVPGIGPAKMSELSSLVTVSKTSVKRDSAANTTGKSRSDANATSTRTSSSAKASATSTAHKIDVNTADVATLETLPGVGPETARAIVTARPFASVDDLERVPGIGPVKLADLRERVTVAQRSAAAKKDTAAKRSSTRSADDERPVEPTGRLDTPRSGDTRRTASISSPASTSTVQGRVNLNTASLRELEALPEIGPVKAQAIIDARPFTTIEDVMRVKGIKEGTFEVIKDKITVR